MDSDISREIKYDRGREMNDFCRKCKLNDTCSHDRIGLDEDMMPVCDEYEGEGPYPNKGYMGFPPDCQRYPNLRFNCLNCVIENCHLREHVRSK